MIIKKAEFVVSNTDYKKCPDPTMPEFAFIGRSNVGKSSLINMLTNQKKMAKTSGQPGKTQLINHFLIDKAWYLVDLPGYGYARTSKSNRFEWTKFISQYLERRENLYNVFVLLDCRLEPQKIDVNFMEWCAENEIPFAMVFTKADKISNVALQKNIAAYKREMMKNWTQMPEIFSTSSETSYGQEKLVNYIESIILGESSSETEDSITEL
jgi:GTP-binding protein